MHATLTKSILRTTLRFLDKTPVGRIIQRFTQDIRSVDGSLSQRLNSVIQLSSQLIQNMIIIVVFTPAFLVPGVTLGIIGGIVARVYIKVSLSLRPLCLAFRLDTLMIGATSRKTV